MFADYQTGPHRWIQYAKKQRVYPMLAPYRSVWSNKASRLVALAFGLGAFVYGMAFALLSDAISIALVAPAAILAGLVVWALPRDLFEAPTRLLEALLLGALFALVVWPNYIAIALPGLPWITLNRLIGLSLVGVLLICASVSTSFRGSVRDALSAAPLLWRLVVAFVFIQIVAVLDSRDVSSSLDRFINYQVGWTAAFFAGVYVFLRPGAAERWAFVLCGAAVVVGLIGLAEYRAGRVIWAGHIPSFLRIENPDVSRVLAGFHREASDQHRVQSTFTTPLGLAEYLAFATPFFIYYLVGRYSVVVKLAAAASLPLVLFVILVTGARLGMIGLGVTVLLYLFFWAALRLRRNRGDIIGATVVLSYPVILSVSVAATFFIGRLRNVVWGSGAATDDSTAARFGQWADGLPKILSHPWGYGIGQAGPVLDWVTASGVVTVDSWYLTLALEYGVLGLAVYVLMLVTATYTAASQIFMMPEGDRELGLVLPVAVALASLIVIKLVFSQADNDPVLYMILSMLMALRHRAQSLKRSAPGAGRRETQARLSATQLCEGI